MPLFADRVMETTTTTGTGAKTLAGAVTGYRAFSTKHLVGELVSYAMESVDANGNPTADWEIGFATFTSATVLTPLVVLESSNANAAVNFGAGTKRIWSNISAFLAGDEFSTSSTASFMPSASSNTLPGVNGFSSLSTLGTVTARTSTTTNRFTRAKRIGHVSATTSAAFGGQHVGVNQFATIGTGTSGGFMYRIRFGCSDAATVATARQFVGRRNATVAPTNTAEPSASTNQFGVCVNSTGNNLQLCWGGSAAQTPVDLGANFPGNGLSTDFYELTLFSPKAVSNTVLYNLERIGTTNVVSGAFPNATPGTTMPLNTAFLGHAIWRCNNGTLAAVGIDIGGISAYADF